MSCHACQAPLDDLLVWEDADKNCFCAVHAAHGVPSFRALGGALPVARLQVAMAQDLGSAKQETAEARKELEALRDKINTAAAQVSLTDGGRAAGAMMLAAGDRTELVMVRSAESGARVEHQLVGVVGALRLTDKAREQGAPLWSVPRGQLVAARGALQGQTGLPFLLHLEGPHSEQQLWCRSAESLDAWLHWIRQNHPQAKVCPEKLRAKTGCADVVARR